MIGLTNVEQINTDASNRSAMLEQAGVTQAGVAANQQKARTLSAADMAARLDGTTLGANPRTSLNPLGIGPVKSENYTQPNTSPPPANSAISVQVEAPRNVLNVNGPLPVYTQPDTSARALLPGQLGGTLPSMLGTSKIVLADGTVRST